MDYVCWYSLRTPHDSSQIGSDIFLYILISFVQYFVSNKYHDNSKTQNLVSSQSRPSSSPQVKGVETKIITRSPIYLGLWTQGFFDPDNHTLHPEALTSMQEKIGKKVAIAHYFR